MYLPKLLVESNRNNLWLIESVEKCLEALLGTFQAVGRKPGDLEGGRDLEAKESQC